MQSRIADDYAAIRSRLHGLREKTRLVVRSIAGPWWNPEHLLEDAQRLYDILGEPIAWCEHPRRFGWGEPTPIRWCRGMICLEENWSFSTLYGIRKLPSRWALRLPDQEAPEYFKTFDDVIARLAG